MVLYGRVCNNLVMAKDPEDLLIAPLRQKVVCYPPTIEMKEPSTHCAQKGAVRSRISAVPTYADSHAR